MFTFVHTADWQIGKPFRNFAERTAGVLEDARLTMIDRLATVAADGGAGHVLVAGDVFDAETLPIGVIARPLEKLAALRSLTWHLLPGNHDPARAGGIWERVSRRGLPPNVLVHSRPVPAEIAPHVWLLPAPLTSRRGAADPTEWMDDAPTSPGSIRLGLAHGSIRGFGGDGEAEAMIAPTRAARARLDYLALGDWHGTTRIDPRTWYAGTPEPDRFPDNEPGFALLVHIAGAGREPEVIRTPTRRFRWLKQSHRVTGVDDLARIERSLIADGTEADSTLARLALTGHLPAAGHAALAEWRERLAARVFHLEIDDSALATVSSARDLEALAGDADLRRAAEWLLDIAGNEQDQRRADAERALGRLLSLAVEGEVEAGA